MALTDTQYEQVLDLTGPNATRTDTDAIFDRVGTVNLTALTWLRRERARISTQPAQFSAAGDYTESWHGTLAMLDKQIAYVETVTAAAGETDEASGGLVVSRIVREDRSRLFTQ